MAEDRKDDAGRELPRDQDQSGTSVGGRQVEGGYGMAQNQQLNPEQQEADAARGQDEGLSRGERYDEQQGGGRGPDSVSIGADDLEEDQRAHQDRGQSLAGAEADRR